MNRAEAVGFLSAEIESRICADFDPATKAWASKALGETIVPRLIIGEEIDDEELGAVRSLAMAGLEADSSDERYALLARSYFEALLGPTADRAYALAGRAVATGGSSLQEASQLVEEIVALASAVEESAPDLAEELGDPIAQAMLDCAWAAGDREEPSRRISVDRDLNQERRSSRSRIGDADPEINRLAAQARAALATSFEAALLAAGIDDPAPAAVAGIRTIYDFAIETLENMHARFGADAVRRVTDDQLRFDLLDTLEAPITAAEWSEDSSIFGTLAARLSRSV